MFVVPTFQNRSSKYTIEVELNSEVFRLRFIWNSREQSWYMDILDQDDIEILTGIKLVINYELLLQYEAYDNLPKGEFILWDLEKNPKTGGVTFDNFGRRYQLIFFTDEEIEEGGI